MIITSQGTAVEIEHGVNILHESFPLIRRFGDIDILFQFKSIKTHNDADANQLRVGAGLVGVAPIEVISNKVRKLIKVATEDGEAAKFPRQMASSIIEALLQVFPNSHQFLSDLFNMDTFQLRLTPKAGGAAIFLETDVEVNIEKLEILYPAVANWLLHVQDIEIDVLDMPGASTDPEADLETTAKYCGKFRLFYQAGWVGAYVCFMMCAKDPARVVWFDPKKKECIKRPNSDELWSVDFDESKLNTETKFRVVLKESIRLAELGCGSFSLPTIIFQLTILSSPVKFPHLYEKDLPSPGPSPAHRLDLRILHVSEKRFVNLLIRPFINMGAFREMLMRDFHAEIDVVPSSTGKHDFFVGAAEGKSVSELTEKYEIIAGHWSVVARLKIVIAPAAGVVTSFLRTFASTQLASPDDLRFWFQLASAVQRDMMLMHGRISRSEGVQPSFELSKEEQTMFRPKQPKSEKQGRGWGRAPKRCTIS